MKTDLVVAGFIFHDNKVLLVHHNKLDLWLPVGGHIEKDETPDQALAREIYEETGLKIEILNKNNIPIEKNIKLATPLHVDVHSVVDHDHCCFNYVCKALNPEQLNINKELKNFGWFAPEDLNKEYILANVRNIALRAFDIYQKSNK